jgi:hypothetical protein
LVIATAGIFCLAAVSRQKHGNYCVFHKRVQACGKSVPIKGLRSFAAALRRVYGRSCDESALDLNRREPLIEETYCMSMQSHLAELEKRHQALEDEITECLTHPAVDDLRIVELKRRKLLVKDEIERLRHNGQASIH